jgi:hypothetical protein
MIRVENFRSGDRLTRDWLDSLARAIRELQDLAIERTQYPLARSGRTLSAILPPGLPPGVIKGQMLLLNADLQWSLSDDSVEPTDADVLTFDEDDDNAGWGPARGQS